MNSETSSDRITMFDLVVVVVLAFLLWKTQIADTKQANAQVSLLPAQVEYVFMRRKASVDKEGVWDVVFVGEASPGAMEKIRQVFKEWKLQAKAVDKPLEDEGQ